ncbi:MAG: OmpA family protein [Pontiellaceae bacterium]|nr:OmpA family protein [Pontiellaceae bacterium]MBN2785337.1 OmpA family protein [Pontiellaceae bacterium]
MILKALTVSLFVGSVAFVGGCRTKTSAEGGWDPNAYAQGGGLGGDNAFLVDNLSAQRDGNRDLFPPVYFAYDSSQVNPEEAGKCQEVASYILKGKGQGVIVEGHADERGSREYNLALGERRALAVRDYLISLGVDPAVIQTKSMGEEDPADMGHGEDAWRLNRRAVFAIY